ncbi:MAG TPA: hypothetical protein VKA84_12130 [Gemmatimonadaceae bacterium]|nr:hypothetical protein [Gemmatimonadaceae bacterium]
MRAQTLAIFATIACAAAAGAAAAAGCAGARPPAAEAAPDAAASSSAAARPLAPMAAQRIVVAPVQQLRGAESVGWSQAMGPAADYLRLVDDEIAFALRERQVGADWVFPPQLAATARRNAPVAADPYALEVAQLLAPPRSGGPVEIVEPLAGQARSLVAFSDARYVLIPTELRFERRAQTAESGGAARAVLRVAVVDARLSRLRWAGDVASDTASAFSPAIAAGVAARLADLVAPIP